MIFKPDTTCSSCSRRPGVVLVLALIVLTVLSVVTAVLSSQVARVKRRMQYRIDYQQARYACDSALKYMLTILPEKNFQPVPREGLPDFSDLYWMDENSYTQYIQSWLQTAEEEKIEQVLKAPDEGSRAAVELPDDPALAWAEALKIILGRMESEPNDPDFADPWAAQDDLRAVDPNRIEVPGPYGVAWPWVMEPIELEIGPAAVRITIEDENAKLPLVWGMLEGEVPAAAVSTFCEVMAMTPEEIGALFESLTIINEQKKFTMDPQPVIEQARSAAARPARDTRRIRTTRGRTTQPQTAQQPQPPKEIRPAIANATDYAKLLHSSLMQADYLSRPLPYTGDREESVLRYLGLWGAQEVNVNTAPRHVLQAAFTFGGREVEIAEEIIRRRQIKPFKQMKELTDELYLYNQEIEKAARYCTTQSSFFKIRVESVSGMARCAAVATVFKDNKTVEKLMILYDQ